MRDEVALVIGTTAADLMFDVCYPNQSILNSALSFNASSLDSLSDDELSKFILVLGQYLVHLKYKENEALVRKIELLKMFDYACHRKIQQKTWKTGIPLKEKTRVVVMEDEELNKLEERKDVAESKLLILDGMYSAFLEYVNAYKKEQGRRLFGKGSEGKHA